MNKKRIVWGSILLGLPCVLLPVILMGYVAWMLNLVAAQQRLETLAAVASSRANGTFSEAAGALKSVAGKDVAISVTVDPSLLGGLIVKMGSRQIDTSLKTKLNSLKLALKEVG